MFARIFARLGRYLRGKEVHNQTIFIRRPDGTVAAKKTCARTLFTAKANRAVHETRDEPLETYGCFPKTPTKLLHNAIDHLAAHECFPDCSLRRPLRPVREQISY